MVYIITERLNSSILHFWLSIKHFVKGRVSTSAFLKFHFNLHNLYKVFLLYSNFYSSKQIVFNINRLTENKFCIYVKMHYMQYIYIYISMHCII